MVPVRGALVLAFITMVWQQNTPQESTGPTDWMGYLRLTLKVLDPTSFFEK
jgi:hypothetical protein